MTTRTLVARVSLLLLPLIAAGASAHAQSAFTLNPYIGGLFLDGSCVYWEDGECHGRFTRGDPAFVLGLRASLALRSPWGVEISYAVSPIDGDPPPAFLDSGLPFSPTDELSVPFNVLAQLYTVAVKRSLHRTNRSDLYVSGSVGGITFKQDGGGGSSFTDFLLGLGIGGVYQLDRLIGLRGDLKAFSEFCREGSVRDGFQCEDKTTLGHLQLLGGVVLSFPGLPIEEPASSPERAVL